MRCTLQRLLSGHQRVCSSHPQEDIKGQLKKSSNERHFQLYQYLSHKYHSSLKSYIIFFRRICVFQVIFLAWIFQWWWWWGVGGGGWGSGSQGGGGGGGGGVYHTGGFNTMGSIWVFLTEAGVFEIDIKYSAWNIYHMHLFGWNLGTCFPCISIAWFLHDLPC